MTRRDNSQLHTSAIASFEPSFLDCLKIAHQQDTTPPSSTSSLGHTDFSHFLKYIAESNVQIPWTPPSSYYDQPLASYFISTSHNTYLTGHQLYGQASVDGYVTALQHCCRCVEIDCWNGDEAQGEREPMVLHGHTATKKIPFRTICLAIKDHAFVATDLPMILSLEIHANAEQQQIMVDIMLSIFKDQLAIQIDDNRLPTPNDLRNKILIKVKYNPACDPANSPSEELEKLSLSRSSTEEDVDNGKQAKPSKIIAPLSQLAIYTRAYHFKSFSDASGSQPHHVFSLSESQLRSVYKEDPAVVLKHNSRYLMRIYPKGARINSSNLNPVAYWSMGAQMVALNWQKLDKGMMLQHAMFADSHGWLLKPKELDSVPMKETNGPSNWLRIKFIAGQSIPIPPESDSVNPYIKVRVHIEDLSAASSPGNVFAKLAADRTEKKHRKDKEDRSPEKNKFKQRTRSAKSQTPIWTQDQGLCSFDYLPSFIPRVSFVRFKVMHDRFGNDRLAAWACIRMDRLAKGLCLLRLYDTAGNATSGIILVKIDYSWK